MQNIMARVHTNNHLFRGFLQSDDGVISRVVDMNTAAQVSLGRSLQEAMGHPVEKVLAPWQNIVDQYCEPGDIQTELNLTDGDQILVFDMSISKLERNEKPIGRIIVMRDISAPKQIQIESEQLIAELDAYAHTVAHDPTDT